MPNDTFRVLFVCIGNICRSPTAEGVFRHQAETSGWSKLFQADSAGTSAYHVGEPPDRRATEYAKARGYDISTLRARQVGPADFERFDLILCMEKEVLETVKKIQAFSRGNADLALFLDYLPAYEGQDVPDPYYGGSEDFEKALDLIEQGSQSLLKILLKKKGMMGCGC